MRVFYIVIGVDGDVGGFFGDCNIGCDFEIKEGAKICRHSVGWRIRLDVIRDKTSGLRI